MYKSDIHSAHAEIQRLKQKLAAVEALKLTKEKAKKVKCKECGGRLHRIGVALGGVGLTITVLFTVFCVTAVGYLWLIKDHKPSHCYIEAARKGVGFKLARKVDWSIDKTIGEYRTMNEAIADAAKINCEIK